MIKEEDEEEAVHDQMFENQDLNPHVKQLSCELSSTTTFF